jgi:hypothetical protein
MLLLAGAAEWGETKGGLAMATLLGHARLIAGAVALAFMLMLSPPAGAQHVNPTAESVKEEQLLGELKRITGECTIPDQRACTLEQPAGRDWRWFHEVALPWIGAIAILGMIGLVVLFYLVIGTVRISPHRSGRVMARFSAAARVMSLCSSPLVGHDQSSSASRATAGASGFLVLSQYALRPEL